MPRRVAYGTVVRLVSMSISAVTLALAAPIPGACIGSLALLTGVIAEAVASRWMARHVVHDLLHPVPFALTPSEGACEVRASTGSPRTPLAASALTTRQILAFYYPLALTSILAIGINPLVTFFLGRSRSALESLAVMPVIIGLVFLFRSGAIAYQEVGVALIGPAGRNERPIARAALALATASALALVAILFTPLAGIYLARVSGLPADLARFALWPARVLALVPALDYLLTFQRSRLILARRTRVITVGAAIEATTVIAGLVIGINLLNLVGALAATCALLAGRLAGNLFLLVPQAAVGSVPGRLGSEARGL